MPCDPDRPPAHAIVAAPPLKHKAKTNHAGIERRDSRERGVAEQPRGYARMHHRQSLRERANAEAVAATTGRALPERGDNENDKRGSERRGGRCQRRMPPEGPPLIRWCVKQNLDHTTHEHGAPEMGAPLVERNQQSDERNRPGYGQEYHRVGVRCLAWSSLPQQCTHERLTTKR